jgi:hypothetical protein
MRDAARTFQLKEKRGGSRAARTLVNDSGVVFA